MWREKDKEMHAPSISEDPAAGAVQRVAADPRGLAAASNILVCIASKHVGIMRQSGCCVRCKTWTTGKS